MKEEKKPKKLIKCLHKWYLIVEDNNLHINNYKVNYDVLILKLIIKNLYIIKEYNLFYFKFKLSINKI